MAFDLEMKQGLEVSKSWAGFSSRLMKKHSSSSPPCQNHCQNQYRDSIRIRKVNMFSVIFQLMFKKESFTNKD